MLFNRRSETTELLDGDDIKTEDLFINLGELHVINKRLGGYRASANGLRDILQKRPGIRTVCDVGSGGGDFIRYMDRSVRKHPRLFFYGIDHKKDCIGYAEVNLADTPNKLLVCDDYRNLDPGFLKRVDVIHCSLFLHHLNDKEIVDFLVTCRQNNCILLCNDLHRHELAYFGIRLLTRLFSRSKLVRNDAPVSVKRGFKKRELESYLIAAGFQNYTVKWTWAFRYILVALP
jgi:2-polyprenyl-3-methyl-5-hydroxy-6-metoxy-1,4-benzoquinol methylase